MKTLKTLFIASALAGFTFTSNAALVTIDNVTGFSGGDSFTPQDFTPLTDGLGINKPDANDPSTWTNGAITGGTSYQHEWYDNYLVGAANSKLAWVAFDFGSSQTNLESLFIINADAQSNTVATSTFNIYYTDTPTVALPAPPGGNSSVDYDFSSGGWTQLGATRNIEILTSAYEYDLSSIASAQFVALEIMTAFKPADGRVGFDEIAFTAVPEPSALALIGLAGMALFIRRRR